MSVMEKIGEAMQQNEEKKNGLRKSILTLMLEWRNFEKDLNVSTTCLKECFNELEAKEKHLTSVQESVTESSKELDSIRESVEKKREDVEKKKEEFCVYREGEIRNLEYKWKDLNLARKGFDEIVKLREEKLNEQEKMVERFWEEIEFERKQLEDLREFVENRFKEISMKEKEFEERTKEFNKIQSWIREQTGAIELKERKFEERVVEFEVKEKILQSMEKEFEERSKEFSKIQSRIREETDALELKERKFDERVEEFESKEKILQSMEKEFEERSKEFSKIQSRIREETDALELKERKFDERVEEFENKEKILQSIEKEIETKGRGLGSARKELMAKENCLDNVKKELRVKETKLDYVKRELRDKEHNLDFIRKKLREKETTLDSVANELLGKVNNLDSVKKQLRIMEDHLSSVKKELELKDKSLDTTKKKLELQEQELTSFKQRIQLPKGEISAVGKACRQRFEELDSREEKLGSVSASVQNCDGEFQLEKENFQKEQGLFQKRMDGIELKEKQVEERFRELKQREELIERRFKVLEKKEKQLETVCNARVKTEPTDYAEVDRVGATTTKSAEIRFFVTMDGKSLQIYLNEREKELDSMSDEVCKALQLSPNPGQLVLDAMEGFYPPHLRKGETEFEASVARRSCILLLEQLIRVSPKIQPIVREAAMELARAWKVKMRATNGNQLEILGFMYLLASYRLVSAFDADELMSLLTIVVEHNKSKDLCRILGFTEKISCFIQNLIAKQQNLEAVKFAFAFELVDRFPPIPILKDYVKHVMWISETVRGRETCSVEEKIEAIEQSVASIRAVIGSILDHKLQSQYPLTQLEECIESLTRLKADATTSSVNSEAQKPQQTQVKQMASTCPSVLTDTKALSSTSSSETASTCKLGHSDAFAVILVGMGGKNLQAFLNDHCQELELLRVEVSTALKLSTDSGMLVLEALGGFYPEKPRKEKIECNRSIIRKSCILLLEQLIRISPDITPQAKLEASKLAFDWKAKMIDEIENHLAILGFLLLVGAYSLASAFDKNELKSLCRTVAQHANVIQICHVLGISHSKGEPLSNNIERRSKGQLLISGCASSVVHATSDPAKIVLDALRKCYSAEREKSKNELTKKRKRDSKKFSSVMTRFPDLLEQLREVSPEIRPQVKTEATEFAVEWRATLIGSWEAIGFLHFLATFELSSSFDSDDLIGFLKIVQHTSKVMDLIRILGLADKIPCFIENLITKRQLLLAIKYIYEFELVDSFPPAPLLKNYVQGSIVLAKQIRSDGHDSRQAQEKAIFYELSALRAAVNRIVLHNLQSEYSPDQLRARIAELERERANLSIPEKHSGFAAKFQCDGRSGGTQCEPISQGKKVAANKNLASSNEGVSIQQSRQKRRKMKRLHKLTLQSKVSRDANFSTAPTLQLHPGQFMQHNRSDAAAGRIFRNYSGFNDHFMVASGVPLPLLPPANPFYHQ
ncbi:FRIGIDA-like protein 5 [Nicotiana sylvestris]|uniref:FRIGIDA-like protein 5 isoform X1 n=1 Tax=Nicotiana sylvestris TaxID=4096 RepID=A0A1U7VFF4_NICSY|nr:PREDICTED: FRIGIDA-like protein 5 isoform X1 [Nicotiana sylvestris]